MKRMSREVAMYLKAYNQTGPGLKAAAEGFKKLGVGAIQVFKKIAQVAAVAFTAIATGAIAIGTAFEQGLANS